MVDDADRDATQALLAEMRQAFDGGKWDTVLDLYSQTSTHFKGQRGARVEATCLASRSLVRKNDRPAARSLLRPIAGGEFAKAIHYDFLAHAFLDLKNYKDAARVCERADALVEREKAPGP